MAPQMLAAESPGTLTFPVPEPAAGLVTSPRWGFARGRLAAFLLVAVVCAINLGETALEERWSSTMTARGLEFASALHWLEGQAGFENEAVRDVVSVYGFSLASSSSRRRWPWHASRIRRRSAPLRLRW
jgi:hypothetical protein